ncbi:uncharacterized protein B0I36DRAFT_333590 [Microdochium trichocladiopsis]|uniref:Uncharacterized protein n=1 Tax=Microdochium trichocladiopsis TaxID=1682393 RepID=A0A9P9BKV3_9PEZI|nr:uncharacterized protein B0I36DRAFT_333590 [Microdochium trichocladiopsis]KAH7020997.1 hypothetical protein B0I36DRAFT_333590 [Microdochium trichocladiopsis]
MASQTDLQELLRLLTTAKVPIKDAMMRIKLLQGSNLRRLPNLPSPPWSLPSKTQKLPARCTMRAKPV